MKNKGFTLVELLAVIVILAIVSMVTYSVVSGSIENTKKKGFETSAKNALEAAKEYVVANYEESDFPEGGIDITKEDVGIKNNNFISGMIVRNEEGIIEVNNLTDGEYCANGTKNKMEVVRGSCTASDETKPEIGIKVLKTKINNVTIMVKMQDAQSGLKEYTYCYGLKGTEKECKTHSLSNERTLVKELIKLDKLKQEAEYEIEVKVKNNSGEEEIEENAEIITFKTLEIEAPEFSISADTYTSSKVLTITYPEVEGYIYKYNKCVEDVCEEEQIVEGTETKVEITGEAKVKASIYKGEDKIISDTINIVGIDNEPPIITSLKIDSEYDWTLEKKFELEIKDEGTGVAIRSFSYNGGITWVKNNSYIFRENGTIKILVRDRLGNINNKFCDKNRKNCYCDDTSCTYVIDKIDNKGPICGEWQGESITWINSSRLLSISCTDEGIGCEKDTYTEEFNKGVITTANLSVTLKDKLGNTTVCTKDNANIYLDKEAPTVTGFSIKSTGSYNGNSVNLNVTGKDNGSGVSEVCVNTANRTDNCNWKSFNGTYKTPYNFSASLGSTVSLYAFIKDKVGNISTAKKTNYTLYKECSQVNEYGGGDVGVKDGRLVNREYCRPLGKTYCTCNYWHDSTECRKKKTDKYTGKNCGYTGYSSGPGIYVQPGNCPC